MGDAAVERSAREIYSDPVMKKFIDVATETVFGALWTRPGACSSSTTGHSNSG